MERLRRILAGIPLTLRGALVAVASGAALAVWGLERLDLLLLVVGASGLAVLVLATILVVSAALWLRRRIPDGGSGLPERSTLEAESRLRTGFSLPGLASVPLVHLHWAWLRPAGVDCHQVWRESRWEEEVVAHRRTLGGALERRITVGDVLGLVRVAAVRKGDAGPRVLPAVGRLRSAPVVQAFSAAEGVSHPLGRPEGDRMEIRRYVPGDSARDIHWKAYARSRQLNVRLRERAIERSRRTVAYLVRGEDDEAAAAAARVTLESEALGPGWSFGADGTDGLVDELAPALAAICRSGDLPADAPTALPAMLDRLDRDGRRSCLAFVPPRAGSWTDAAIAAARRFSGSMTFVVATDGLDLRPPAPRWHRWIWLPSDTGSGLDTEEFRTLLARLATSGAPLLVVDRPTGRTWSPGPARGREWVA